MVDLKGLFEAVSGQLALAHDAPSVVSQHIDTWVGRREFRCQASHLRQFGKSSMW
ncbi:Uncharacterised protein [Mycolicibacterium fortuitum]|uniref:Uncharacterized protein n=1 Tax=Mycolicibacterium fortuitum TaxID=1766 RepID=A0A378UCT8_MYCFO|nr:Uncharacterised protein [Mycolicibacterium fortuitum]